MSFPVIIIAILFILVIVLFFAWRDARKNNTATSEEFTGICNIALDRTVRKRVNTGKILALFAENNEMTNVEIRAKLGVSSRTAVRYLDALEKAGRIRQVGVTGQAVTYRLQ